MTGFFSRLFGGKKKLSEGEDAVVEVVESVLAGLIEKADLDLSFEIKSDDQGLVVELSGGDADQLKEREGELIEAFQLFMKRVLQHKLPESRIEVTFDSNGFREENHQALIDLAEKLKTIVIEKGRSVYVRALMPKDRKVVHQYLSSDDRVKSKSIGDGLFKKIKIFPASGDGQRRGGGGNGGGRRFNGENNNNNRRPQNQNKRDQSSAPTEAK
jgi:spoIIIJ-associated protein